VKSPADTYCGYVAIIGRQNVGKSTLLNHLLGQKISITSRKPQTTRHNIVGIDTEQNYQTIYVDTPGQHTGQKSKALNRYLNRAAISAMADVDVVLFVVEKNQWTEEDRLIAERTLEASGQIIVVINKIDQLKDKNQLLPHLKFLSEQVPGTVIIPVSALQQDNIERLKTLVRAKLPAAPFFFDESQITDRSIRFLCAEIIREKLTRQLGEELPYAITVGIEKFEETATLGTIDAVIWVERSGQKNIVIGEQGSRIKSVGQQAREEIEVLLSKKVMLSLWCKVKSGWSDDERALRSLGYDDSGS